MHHHAQLVRTFDASVVKKEAIASMTSFLYSSIISRTTWKEREESLEAHIPHFWSLAGRGRTGVRTKDKRLQLSSVLPCTSSCKMLFSDYRSNTCS